MDASATSPPALSIVVPVRNEEAVLAELVRRCRDAAVHCAGSFEIVLVDDASTDSTRAIIQELSTSVPELRPIHLETNAGQFGATKAGLSQARGRLVAVLDGDLQDPPEVLPELCAALERGRTDVAYAVKAGRDEGGAFRAVLAVYHRLGRMGGASAPPLGAGSYCVMHARWARRIAEVGARRANLAAVVAALGARGVTVPYHKHGRYHGRSRVGAAGLVREACESLILTGAAARILRVSGAASGLLGASTLRRRPVSGLIGLGLAGGFLVAARAADHWAGRALSSSDARRRSS